jgi:hypothetical protein
MPFGIPCPDADYSDAIQQLQLNNNTLQNVAYQIVFPLGQEISVNERVLAHSHNVMRKAVKKLLTGGDNGVSSTVNAIASKVGELLNSSAVDLAQTQAAIALLPQRDTPDVPAADIRQPTLTTGEVQLTQIVVANDRRRNADIDALLNLLYLLGVTPAQVRAYLEYGTIPDLWLCPNPATHDTMAAPATPPCPPGQVMSDDGLTCTIPGGIALVNADGFWED